MEVVGQIDYKQMYRWADLVTENRQIRKKQEEREKNTETRIWDPSRITKWNQNDSQEKEKYTPFYTHTQRHAVELVSSERKKGNTGIETNRERLKDD